MKIPASDDSRIITRRDKLLVERFKGGDQTAFDELFRSYWQYVYIVANQVLKNHEDAEEITQDAFLRARRGLLNFRGDSAFKTWLYRIAFNLARNRYWYWRRRKRHASVSFDAPASSKGENDLTLAEVLSNPDEAVEQTTINSELVSSTARVMDHLSTSHREILILRNVKNLTYEEIAAIMGINCGTVKSRIARARKSLRSKLDEHLQ